ncbi:MAG: DUF5681 domain-containing protein [Steroidobacteraceae bacterium]|nr:hypothetical protein [Nevskiaceae bacterium]MCP5471078.1 hypothetical protein [Nevskiaceae bacterium]
MSDGRFKPGVSGNPRGRPRGIVEKRARVTNALLQDAAKIAEVVSAAAQGGDMTAAALVLARSVPTLKPEGSLVEFALDTSAPLATQMAQVTQAVANGDLTVEEGKHLTDMIRQLAEVRALENGGGDSSAEKLIEAFKQFAQSDVVKP